ncbi:MAG: TlyA family RNA methyltransferase [Chloroflexi bacterium]|nr:TlyA family RNA methyltransferase [Chloroflexota bacterium]
MKKERIDILLVEMGLAESRSQAQRLIMAGEVLADNQQVFKSSQVYSTDTHISLKSKPKYVSRGGYKLEKALIEFDFENLKGKVCVDVGASTGGFTDCLLQFGAEKVFAVDVGYGQLHERLRKDDRVVVMERTNIKDVDNFPEPIDLVVIDASFISLKSILPTLLKWNFKDRMDIVALIKPQFEAGRSEAARGKGVIKSAEIHQRVIEEVIGFTQELGFHHYQTIESPIEGLKGNKEFLVYLDLKQ